MKLSIITINLNNKPGLIKTIESVVNQTYPDFEYIIIDGKSNDGSIEVIREYSDRISFWVSESDSGIYNAMNKGIRKSTGEYCLFLNSGDYLNNVNVLNNLFSIPVSEDLIIGSVLLQGGGKKELFEIPDIDKLTFRHFIDSTLPHPGVFVKRYLFDKIGYFNEELVISSDLEFFLIAIFKYGVTLRKITDTISVFDWQGVSSLPQNAILVKNERMGILEKHFPRFLSDYKYLEKLESENRNLEYKIEHNITTFISKILKRVALIR